MVLLNSTSSNDTVEYISTSHNTALIVTCSTIALLGITLNSLTIAVLCNGRTTSRQSHFQLINLAVADLLSALIYPAVLVMVNLYLPFHASSFWCTLLMSVNTTVFYASPLWNVTMSIEKFIAVYTPLHMLMYQRRHKVCVAVLVWTLAAVSQMDTFMYARTMKFFNGTLPLCVILNPIAYTDTTLYDSILALRYVIPATIIVTMYALIGFKLLLKEKIGDVRISSVRAEREKKKVRG